MKITNISRELHRVSPYCNGCWFYLDFQLRLLLIGKVEAERARWSGSAAWETTGVFFFSIFGVASVIWNYSTVLSHLIWEENKPQSLGCFYLSWGFQCVKMPCSGPACLPQGWRRGPALCMRLVPPPPEDHGVREDGGEAQKEQHPVSWEGLEQPSEPWPKPGSLCCSRSPWRCRSSPITCSATPCGSEARCWRLP